MSEFIFEVKGRPMPAVRMTQRTKWGKREQKYLKYKGSIGWAAKAAKAPYFVGDISVSADVYIGGGVFGDIDNYCKTILDGLNGVCWRDDKQVIEIHLKRHKSKSERIVIALKGTAAKREWRANEK